jgi:nucleoside-specific outer membrane channel protein Tsx
MKKKIALVALAAAAVGVHAADWSDTSLAFTTGTKYAEPFGSTNITKNIYSFKNVSGDKYGQNFFNVDMLQSNSEDKVANGNSGAQEVYAVYRRLFDLQKITGKSYAFGPVKNMGVTAGFDWNTKNDTYASKKRMLVVGPTFMMDVKQGFFDVSLLMLDESNAPNTMARYHYQNHAALSFVWGLPTGVNNLSFEGWADYIAPKGTAEDGVTSTKAETHFNGALMYDISASVGASKNTFKVGAGYEYWKNKFGNPTTSAVNFASTPQQAGPGATAKTPFVKAEYHF